MLNFLHFGALLLAQSVCLGAAAQSFDVASVKAVPFTPGDYHANLGTAIHGEVTLTNATLSECLRYAYDIHNDDQIAGPDWIKSRELRFTIVAKAPPDTPLPVLRTMLQNLLAERFRMTVHHEGREQKYLALMVGRKGLKMHASRDESNAPGGRQIMGTIIASRMDIGQLVTLLSRFLRQAVVDQSGLEGPFDIRLEWTPDNLLSAATDLASRPSLFDALPEQLGLALESRRGPLETIVVDRADRVPLGN